MCVYVILWWCVMLFKWRLAVAQGWWYGRLGKQEIVGPSGLISPTRLLSWLKTASCCEHAMVASEARWRARVCVRVCLCVQMQRETWVLKQWWIRKNTGQPLPSKTITVFTFSYAWPHWGVEKIFLKKEYLMNWQNNVFFGFCFFLPPQMS